MMKESGFKPNKDCKFHFPIIKKPVEPESTIHIQNKVLYNNFMDIPLPRRQYDSDDKIVEDIKEYSDDCCDIVKKLRNLLI